MRQFFRQRAQILLLAAQALQQLGNAARETGQFIPTRARLYLPDDLPVPGHGRDRLALQLADSVRQSPGEQQHHRSGSKKTQQAGADQSQYRGIGQQHQRVSITFQHQ